MTTLKQLAEYNLFIKWFETHYPQLCKMYCDKITPATDEKGFILNWKELDKEITAMLYQVIYEYNYLYKNTG